MRYDYFIQDMPQRCTIEIRNTGRVPVVWRFNYDSDPTPPPIATSHTSLHTSAHTSSSAYSGHASSGAPSVPVGRGRSDGGTSSNVESPLCPEWLSFYPIGGVLYVGQVSVYIACIVCIYYACIMAVYTTITYYSTCNIISYISNVYILIYVYSIIL